MDLGEVGSVGEDLICLAEDWDRWRALVNAELTFGFYEMLGKLSNGFTTGGLPSSAQLHIVSQFNSIQFNSIQLLFVYVQTQRPRGQLQS
jgi:hypothetical protein